MGIKGFFHFFCFPKKRKVVTDDHFRILFSRFNRHLCGFFPHLYDFLKKSDLKEPFIQQLFDFVIDRRGKHAIDSVALNPILLHLEKITLLRSTNLDDPISKKDHFIKFLKLSDFPVDYCLESNFLKGVVDVQSQSEQYFNAMILWKVIKAARDYKRDPISSQESLLICPAYQDASSEVQKMIRSFSQEQLSSERVIDLSPGMFTESDISEEDAASSDLKELSSSFSDILSI